MRADWKSSVPNESVVLFWETWFPWGVEFLQTLQLSEKTVKKIVSGGSVGKSQTPWTRKFAFMTKGRLPFRVLIGLLIVWGCVFVVWQVIQAPRDARTRLAHIRYVLTLVAQYVRDHQGAWPSSWEEIEAFEKSNPPADIPPRKAPWPELRAHVKVDFQADPRKLLQAGLDGFSAISPKGACGDYGGDVERLLQAIRESLPTGAAAEKVPASAATRTSLSSSGDVASQATKSPWPESVKKARPSETFPGPSEKLASEKSSPPQHQTGLSKEKPAQSAEEKRTGQEVPSEQEKPSPKGKSEAPSSKQPPRIVLPGLD